MGIPKKQALIEELAREEERLADTPDEGGRLILATGRYVGEGVDEPAAGSDEEVPHQSGPRA